LSGACDPLDDPGLLTEAPLQLFDLVPQGGLARREPVQQRPLASFQKPVSPLIVLALIRN
jgi:hypothetical protein